MKPLMTLFVCIITSICFAQQPPTYEISEPVGLPQVGWNKVLMMRNGNTMLFHFEPRKAILVKVFDSSHKEIATQKHICKLLDINTLDNAEIKGFYDINGEAVMFVVQHVENKKTLLRMRFDATTGKLLEEGKVVQSLSQRLETIPYLVKEKNSENYNVFCFGNIVLHRELKLELLQLNGNHQIVKTVPLNIDAKPYTSIEMIGADIDTKGDICVTLLMAKELVGSIQQADYNNQNPNKYEKHIAVCYLPKGANEFIVKYVQGSGEMKPYHASVAYDPFDDQLNVLILDVNRIFFRRGLFDGQMERTVPLFLTLNKGNMALNMKWLMYDNVEKQRDTTSVFNSIPLKMFTNKNGLVTVITENYVQYSERANGADVPYTSMGNIGITQYDEKGNELWGQSLHKKQYVQNYFYPNEAVKRACKPLFRDLPEQAYQNQFISVNCYNDDVNTYLFYNDLASNFERPVDSMCKPIYTYNASNSFYYKVDKKRVVTKHFLFGKPNENESKNSLLESADFNEQSKVYTTLMLKRTDKDYTFHVAWCHL